MKWYIYLICFIMIVIGTFCGIQLYRELNNESYINGSIDITNKFSQESFSYRATGFTFYHDLYDDTNTYTGKLDLRKTENFDGVENDYEILFNDYKIVNADIQAGSVFFVVSLDFRNTDGEIVCNGVLNVSVKFLSDKSVLTLSTVGIEQARFFEQYFTDNGIAIYINEIGGETK